MSKDNIEEAPKKKGKLKKLLLISLGTVVLLGGGGGAALYMSGSGPFAEAKGHEEEGAGKPKLLLRDGGTAPAVKPGTKLDASKYQASYFEVEKNFTSNLRDADGFMQVSLGVSTFYDASVIENLKKNELPIRSAVLMTLADQEALFITTAEGKQGLRKALKDTINRVLEEKEGFGGIDDVYFTSFVIQ